MDDATSEVLAEKITWILQHQKKDKDTLVFRHFIYTPNQERHDNSIANK